jgi:hypothetical protein
MISLEKESKHPAAKVIERAVAFFGPGGWGLEMTERGDCCARFEGAGGHVYVTASDREKARGSTVEVESREFEHAAKEFLTKI